MFFIVLLTLCEAHRADWWVAEHHSGNTGVVQLGVLLSFKQSVRQLSACSNGNCPNTWKPHQNAANTQNAHKREFYIKNRFKKNPNSNTSKYRSRKKAPGEELHQDTNMFCQETLVTQSFLLLFCIKALTSNKSFFVNYRDEELIFLVLISIHHFTLPSSEVTEKDQLIH